MILTDTHAHLYAEQFDDDRQEMLKRALENGVSRLFLPNIDLESYNGMMELAAGYPENCFPLIGLHPCSVKEDYPEVLDRLLTQLDVNAFYGIGEIGLDLYWDKTTLDAQKHALLIQIEWAKERKLPVVLHCRDAYPELLDILESQNDDDLFGIFHCFTGSLQEANRVLNLGRFKLGIGGIVTFKNAGLAEVVSKIDLKHLVLETDSPYLAPHPYRGKRNESAYLKVIAEKVAEIKSISLPEVAAITTQNSLEIFNK